MTLELRSIVGKGDLQRERLTFRASTDLDVGDFAILQTGFSENAVTTDVHHTFWFPYHAVAKGDLIVLYTRQGTESTKPLKLKGTAHFFYWNLGQPIWADDAKAAVLLNAPTWEGKCARELWTTPPKEE